MYIIYYVLYELSFLFYLRANMPITLSKGFPKGFYFEKKYYTGL